MAVKLCWFNLMPWPDLPDRFREDYRSVWVDIPNALFDPARANQVYHEYMDQLEFADEMGFDGIGVNKHHQNGYGIMPSPNIEGAGIALLCFANQDIIEQTDEVLEEIRRHVEDRRTSAPLSSGSPAEDSQRPTHASPGSGLPSQ